MARQNRRPAELGLDAIQIEGGLIAPEQVAKIAATERNAKTAADYDCPKGTSLGDEIARYFRIGQAHWQAYNRIDAPTLTQTAKFAHDLLAEAFGFTDLTGPIDHRQGTRRYRIAWEAQSGRVPVIVAAAVPEGDGFAKALPEFGDGPDGRAKRNPVVLLQDWLNHTDRALWGLVFAGDRVRLMRDNASLTRAAWIEADLGAMFRDEMFADFTAWWLLMHASRFGISDTPPSSAPLEKWREEGQKQGTAVRNRLREGVETALKVLGQGLVEANPEVKARIEDGTLTLPALFEELLRTVYRLIFLAVAEDRDLLHPRNVPQKTRALYADSYAFSFWRERSARRAAYDAHNDAWEGMKVTLAALEQGQPLLGLPALGGLFARAGAPTLNAARIPNRRFLTAIYNLGFITVDSMRTRINWRDMKTEELGSVYESLLEIRPFLAPNGDFTLDSGAKGNDRKTSGSYYTPDSLVETLLDSALDPVLAKAEAEGGVDAILDLRVIDPACGSGHFLLGAARRMADKVAELRDPDAPDRQMALRDVVSRCIHGVDRNPMAVELAKVALWIESVSPGQPLGFLDANIRCGDALLGVFSLKALEEGVPDEAFKPLTGDDKAAAKYYLQQNKAAKKGQGQFDWSGGGGAMPPKRLAANLSNIKAMPEETVRQVEEKKRRYEAWRHDPARYATRVACDLYTAAFLLPKTEIPIHHGRNMVPTTADVLTKLGGGQVYGPLEATAVDAAGFARVLHWPLAFPDVMVERGGFDVVLGNPPWERIKLQEQEFFAGTEIADAPNAAARTRMINTLATATLPNGEPDAAQRALHAAFGMAKRVAEAMSLFARVPGDSGGRYRYTGTGDVNTYALFTEHFLNLMREGGRAGVIVPTGIATDATTAPFFGYLVDKRFVRSLFDFRNIGFFEGVAQSQGVRFALVTLGKDNDQSDPQFAFKLEAIGQLEDHRRHFTLSPDSIRNINPNTGNLPIFRSKMDAKLSASIQQRVPVLIDDSRDGVGNRWSVQFMRMFDMATDSGLFRTAEQLSADGWSRDRGDWVRDGIQSRQAAIDLLGSRDAQHQDLSVDSVAGERYVPLYEAKMIHQYNHRHGDYALATIVPGKDPRQIPQANLSLENRKNYDVTPRYWLPSSSVDNRLSGAAWKYNWLIGWRDITSGIDERTLISGIIPNFGCNDKFLLAMPHGDANLVVCFYACLNSLACDYLARQKLGGTSFKYFVFKQLPILPPAAYNEADLTFIVPRVLELTYTSRALTPFARDLGYEGAPFDWDEDRRAQLRAELDGWYALAYGLTRDELRYVLDPKDVMGADYPSETFRVLQKNEQSKYSEYRTRRLVLGAYDTLVTAMPDTAAVPDGQWQYQITDELDVRHLIAGLARRMRQPRPVREMVQAFVFAARPHLLMRHLDPTRQAEWRRLVGADADLPIAANVVGIASAQLGRFTEARTRLTADRALRYDAATATWDRGAAIYDLALPPWVEGRADFVWHAMRAISLDAAANALPQEEQTFLARAIAA
ncbi:Eco57I restriction-modification methylase domain-containing protein [Sphingomonas sp. GB1N7]|uniref:Eco57I restriction-modification methylase domain-containing protein n=1 Tax=Parasphingomonas caseinilytica TaxID=3096158 RepID=UPI002FC95C9E